MALLLVGLGVDELSTVATSIPANKELIRALSYKSARTVAAQALQYDDPEDVRTLVREHMATLKLT